MTVCPECGKQGLPPSAQPTRAKAALVGVGLVLTHTMIIVGAGHGAVPIGQFYFWAMTGTLNFGPYGYHVRPILAGIAGCAVVAAAPAPPHRLIRQLLLGTGTLLLAWAWLYFQFSVSEGASEITLGMSVPFLGFVAAAAWQVRRLWWIW